RAGGRPRTSPRIHADATRSRLTTKNAAPLYSKCRPVGGMSNRDPKSVPVSRRRGPAEPGEDAALDERDRVDDRDLPRPQREREAVAGRPDVGPRPKFHGTRDIVHNGVT